MTRKWAALTFMILYALPIYTVDATQPEQTESRVEIRPTRVERAPVIDGILDDSAWQQVSVSEPFITYNPTRGEVLPQRTEVWTAYDAENLYFAFRCYDNEPDQIKTSVTQRDGMFSDDWVGLSLDALGTRQTSYDLFVNPNGIQGDILTSAVSGEDGAPDFVWDSAGRITDQGYEVEMRIPLRSIRFNSGNETIMGVLFWRRISRLGTSGSWPEIPAGQGIFNIHARAVFNDLRNPFLLELLPSITYGRSSDRVSGTQWQTGDESGDFGMGMKYGLTSSVTVEATYNPDFSQIESDAFQAEVNLRYPVFYQEKRPFFMEGMDIFDFSIIGHGFMGTAVHTRRIVDPGWGSKLTGSIGRTAFGILTAGDEWPGYAWENETNPNEGRTARFLISRGKYTLGGDNFVGGIYSGRSFAGSSNHVVGSDAQFRFLENHQTTFSFLRSRSEEPGSAVRNGNSVHWTYQYGNRTFGAAAAFEHYDRDFEMASAFLQRTGVDNGWIWLSPNIYPNPDRLYWLRRISPEFVYSQTYDRVTKLRDIYYRFAANTFFTRQGMLHVEYNRSQEAWQNQIFKGDNFYVNGDIQMWRWLAYGGLIGWRDSIYYPGEPSFLGKVFYWNFGINLQPNDKYLHTFSVYHEDFNRASDGEPIYDLNIINTRATYQFNRYFFVRATLRYNSNDEELLTDFLASFTLIPGTVLHLGYGSIFDRRQWQNEQWIEGAGHLTELHRGIFFKASYLWRR